MRLCLVSQEYPPETARGGIGTQTYAKAHGMCGLGHDVTVLSASLGARTDRADGPVRVIRIPGYHQRMTLSSEAAAWLTYSAEVAAELAQLQARTPFDLVEFPEWGGEGFIHFLNQTEWNHVPSIVQIHGPVVMFADTVGWPAKDSDLYRVATLMEATALSRADAVYSSSRHSAEWCSRYYGTSAEIPVMHTGVDTDVFQPQLSRNNGPVILFVGRIDDQKGAGLVFEAAIQLVREFPSLKLCLVGRADSPLARSIQHRATQLGLENLIETRGYVAHTDLSAEFAAADVMAAPSKGEGGPGFVYLEAMACGLPVVACREGGASEAVRDGVTGFLTGQDNVDELTANLRRLLSDHALRRRMGDAARKHVLATANRTDCLLRIEGFYREVVARAAAATASS